MTANTNLLAALIALAATPALAQGIGPINMLGTIEQIDAGSVALVGEEGVERFTLAPTLLILQTQPATLADIKPEDFIASAAMRLRDGKLHSTELRIFPAAMRGVGEGQRPMNDARDQTMTNAVVTGSAIAGGTNTLKVTFSGAESELVVDAGVPITRITVVDRSLAKPGVRVRVQGVRSAEAATVTRMTVQ